MKTFRVLHILSGMNHGGAEAMIMNYYRNIDRNKIQFDFLLTSSKKGAYFDEVESLGGKIYIISPLTLRTMHLYLRDLNKFFKYYREYIIVHSHTSSKSVFPLLIAKINNIPVRVCHSHNSKSEGGFKGIIRHLLKFPLKFIATDFFACGEKAAVWLYGRSYVKKQNVKIISNAIDSKKYLFDIEKRKDVRKKFNIENKLVIGHIGRFNLQKNHDFLIDIFYEINKKYPDSVLMIIGDGELRKEIEKKIDTRMLNDYVILTGPRNDVHELLQAMDIFIFPSLYEGLPVSVIEAQASGLNCILSDCITKEADVTDLISYVSLEECSEKWAEKAIDIINSVNCINRIKYNEILCSSPFEINESSKILENFYIERARKNE